MNQIHKYQENWLCQPKSNLQQSSKIVENRHVSAIGRKLSRLGGFVLGTGVMYADFQMSGKIPSLSEQLKISQRGKQFVSEFFNNTTWNTVRSTTFSYIKTLQFFEDIPWRHRHPWRFRW